MIIVTIGTVILMMKIFVTINSWLTLYSFHIECNHWEVLLREAVVHTQDYMSFYRVFRYG